MNNFDQPKRESILVFADQINHPVYKSISIKGEKIRIHSQNDALKTIRNSEPDVIIIDCGFKINNGINLLIKIKKGHPEVPIILLTDKSSEELAIKAFRAGARDYIKKPINISALQSTLKTLLQIKRSSKEKRKQFIQNRTLTPKKNRAIHPYEIPQSIIRAIRYMDENFSYKITLQECAKKARLSKYHFCRIFKKHMGITPMNYIFKMRSNLAKDFLRSSNLNISEIAYSVGFGSYNSFIIEFKKYTGTTPTKYRELIKQK